MNEPLTVSQPLPTPASPPAHVELHQDSEGQGSHLPLGRAVTGVVAKLVSQAAGQFKYELVIHDSTVTVLAEQSYPVGTILDLFTLVGDSAGVRLLIRGTEPQQELQVLPRDLPTAAGATEQTAASPGADRSVPALRAALEEQVARALRFESVKPDPQLVTRLATQIQNEGIVPQSAAQAAARLTALGIPQLAQLLRGGSLAEATPAYLELGPQVAQLADAVHAYLPAGTPAGAVSRDQIVEWLRQSLPPASDPAVPLHRVHGDPVLRALDALLSRLLDGDETLIRTREELQRLQTQSPTLPRDLQMRAEELLRTGGEGVRHLDDVHGVARGRAIESLFDLERSIVERNPHVKELRGLIREVHQRLEATTYLQLLEFLALEDPDTGTASGLWGLESGRFPFRITVRDQREEGPGGKLRFVMDIDSKKLGRVHVAGELKSDIDGDPRLTFHMGAENESTQDRIEKRLGELLEALRSENYDPRATVGRISGPRRAPDPADEVGSDGLDVRV